MPALLSAALRAAVPAVAVPTPATAGTRCTAARWGAQLDIPAISAASPVRNPVAIAANVAKYASKAAGTVTAGMERAIRSVAELTAGGCRANRTGWWPPFWRCTTIRRWPGSACGVG